MKRAVPPRSGPGVPPRDEVPRRVQRTYLFLLLLHTLAASFIWGINTLFLLDAGLSNTGAFGANACFTAGLVLFEIPTGVVADLRGRRASYLLGTITLLAATLLYYAMWRISAPFWAWALVSLLLGLGFTFFSGAVEAWLVDALKAGGFQGELQSVLARGEIVAGAAMLGGSVAGGAIAQVTNLGVPYLLRAGMLALSFGFAFVLMRDTGFVPASRGHRLGDTRRILAGAVRQGFGNASARWLMLAAPFSNGVMIYAFYAMQPYLLQLHGDRRAYGVAGLAAAIVAGAQIAGGLLVPHLGRAFRRPTSVVLAGAAASGVILALIGALPRFAVVLGLLTLWGLVYAAVVPVRQAYLNGLIRSEERATVLSFDSMLGSAGGVGIQPVLGRAADAWGYPASYLGCSIFQTLAIPVLIKARARRDVSDLLVDAAHPEPRTGGR